MVKQLYIGTGCLTKVLQVPIIMMGGGVCPEVVVDPHTSMDW